MHETRANGASLQIDAVGIVGQLRQRQRPDQRVTVDQAEFQQARPLHVGDPSPSSAADSAGGPSSTVENGRLAVPREDDSPKRYEDDPTSGGATWCHPFLACLAGGTHLSPNAIVGRHLGDRRKCSGGDRRGDVPITRLTSPHLMTTNSSMVYRTQSKRTNSSKPTRVGQKRLR
jgi:hypothetical protein